MNVPLSLSLKRGKGIFRLLILFRSIDTERIPTFWNNLFTEEDEVFTPGLYVFGKLFMEFL